MSCEGENPADIENIGPVKYYPRRGFPGYFYPFENSEGYLSPLVAVHFERPVRKCLKFENKCWTKNVIKVFISTETTLTIKNFFTAGSFKNFFNIVFSCFYRRNNHQR